MKEVYKNVKFTPNILMEKERKNSEFYTTPAQKKNIDDIF